ncbi:MAG: hypothetical protein HY088_05235 [Ignavibacteriales bacterium]|nr:hypothetical protein [Ignavibacteriales bacterium]
MEEKKFVIVYKKAPDFRTYPAQVIWGGPSPDGAGIVMNFGVDHVPTPNYVQHSVGPDGKVDMTKIDQIAQVGNIERELFGALFISIDEARKTAKWLMDIVNQVERGKHE